MRTIVSLIILFGVIALPLTANSQEKKKHWMLSLSGNYGSWSGGDADGTQSIMFTQISYDSDKWGAAVTGSYATVSYTPPGEDNSFDVSSLTDTKLSTYYAINSKSFILRAGLDFGFPTGYSSYSEDELSTVITDDISSDLMMLNSYGAGTNISPHFMIAKKYEKLNLGFGMKYEVRGEYDITSDVEDDNFDPGDWLFTIANATYMVSPGDMIDVTLFYSRFAEDAQGGENIFRQGDTLALELRYFKKWTDDLSMIASVSYRTQEKNEVLAEGDIIESEVSNSNNNTLDIYINDIYRYTSRLSFTGLLGVKMVGENGYVEGDDYFDAGRRKYYIEPGLLWKINKTIYSTFKLRYATIEDKADAWSVEDETYSVINFDVGVVYIF